MENNNDNSNVQYEPIYLDSNYLNGVPNEKHSKAISKDNYLGLKEEIIYGAPSCFVITGYRGVGKTSFVQDLKERIKLDYEQKEDLKGKKIIFVNCNFVNGDKKENILRKLIRQLVSSSSEYLEDMTNTNPALGEELSNLYKRTFYSVEDVQTNTIKNIFTWDRSINFVILMFIFLLLPIFYFFDLLRDILFVFLNKIKEDPKNTTYVTALISLISLILSFFTYKIGKSYTKEKIDKTEIKTLYDEEIAEVRLKECIDKLTGKDKKVKIVFILDELDKFENEEELDTFLGELKPILINGKATFLLITGQNLSNRLEKTIMVDDAILPSIVQDTYHITLPEEKELEDLFLEITLNDNLDKNLYEDYLNSLILKSKRVPRKFINILRKEAKWDYELTPPKPYIVIPHEKKQIYERDSKLLKCINAVINEHADKRNKHLLDFLVSQLMIFTEKLKLMGAASFQIEDIQIDEDLKTKFPKYYIDKLNNSIQILIEKMDKRNILKYEELSSSYSFLEILDEDDILILTIKQLKKEFIGIEEIIRSIHKKIYNYDESALFNIVKDLFDLNIINKRILETIKVIIDLKNNFNPRFPEKYNIREIADIERDIHILKGILMEKYTQYLLKNSLDSQRFSIEINKIFREKSNHREVDIFITDNKLAAKHQNIVFELKVFSTSSERRVQNLIRQLENQINQLSLIESVSKVVLVLFTSSQNNGIKTLIEERIFNLGIQPNLSLHIIVVNMYDIDDSLNEQLINVLL